MASSFHSVLLCSFLIISSSLAAKPKPKPEPSFKPKALFLPVSKDSSTKQYITQFSHRSPDVAERFTLDLGGQFLWVFCDEDYFSSTYFPAHCGTAQCSLAGASSCGDCFSFPSPGCNNNTCSLIPDNTVKGIATIGEVASDYLLLRSTNGKNPTRVVSIPNFLFVCGSQNIKEGLPAVVRGMAGLGRTKISLPSQFSSFFGIPRKFALCLSSSSRTKGVVIFGDGPYVFLPNIDASTNLMYTPLIINPVSTASAYSAGDPSSEYFIQVKSIKVNEKVVPLNTTLLNIDKEGNGGAKISTVHPYTVLETSIYKAVLNAFNWELAHVPRVAPFAPFEACFNSKNIVNTPVGPPVPTIDLVLQNKKVFWRIYGANSMVQVKSNVICLGFVDGGVNPRTSIVIGGHQIGDNLLQFDLASSRLGFSSTLLSRQTSCSNFNFTASSNAFTAFSRQSNLAK